MSLRIDCATITRADSLAEYLQTEARVRTYVYSVCPGLHTVYAVRCTRAALDTVLARHPYLRKGAVIHRVA